MLPRLRLSLLCLLLSLVALPAVARTTPLPFAADPADYTLTSVSSLGGNATALAVDAGVAYMAEGSKLAVIDVRDATQPRRLATVPLSARARDIVAENGWVYLALGAHGLLILDVHNPSAPAVRARLPLPGEAVAADLQGTTLYVAAGNGGMQIVDVSDTAHPVRRGSFLTLTAQDVFVNGVFAYLADGDGGLLTIDVRNPAQPTLRATHPAQAVQAVRVIGGRAYVLAGAGYNRDNTPIITLQTFTVEAAPGGSQSGDARGGGCLNVVGAYAYVCGAIYDIRNPQQLTLVSSYPIPSRLPQFATDVAGDFVYVAGAGLKIINVRNPASPTIAGQLPAPLYVNDVELAGDLAYITDFDNGWQIVDVSNPAAPRILSQNSLPNNQPPMTIEAAGSVVYVGALSSTLYIFDVSDPAHPIELGRQSVENYAAGVLALGARLYVDTNVSLEIFDVSDPQNIQRLSVLKPAMGGVSGFAVSGDLLYLANPFEGLLIYDISDPAQPELLKTSDVEGTPYGISIVGNRAYLGSSLYSLQIFDLSDPLAPVRLGVYRTPDVLYQVEIIDHVALLGLASGIQIVDLSDPANPALVSATKIAGGARAMDMAGQLVAIGPDRPAEGQGLQLLRLLPVAQRLFLPQISQ